VEVFAVSDKIRKEKQSVGAYYQRGDTGQKPKHAPFCVKGATTHTSLHQIGPNLASN
jgi:hypothetical protein